MVNRIRTVYPHGLNKSYRSKFCVGSKVQYETPEESWRTYWPKCSEYNKKEVNSLNILQEKLFLHMQ